MTTEMFSKISLGDVELQNRITMAPMTRARCTPGDDSNTMPNDLMVEYYAQRAGAGLIITEATAISELGYGWINAPLITTPEHAAAWKKVTDAVHEKNGKIYLQLWHMGRQAHSSFHPSTNYIVSASDVKISTGNSKDYHGNNVEHETPRALTVEQIQETINDYVKAARLSKEAGFDGVEIHGANGYLIDQFLQSYTNKRTDEYGGSVENRVRFLKEIVEAVIADGSFPAISIGVRMSPNGSFGDMGSDDNDVLFPHAAEQMSKYGLAYLHVMDGTGFGAHGKCKLVTAMDMKIKFKGPLMVNVGLSKESGEGMLRSGVADLVAYGRPYISNPDLAERFQNKLALNPDSVYEDWWSPIGAKGYTDFPFYKQPADASPVGDEENKEAVSSQ
eukprot:CAMPEP_0198139938 /NCGR_PEP_ID=MMETSP1443-20131203/3173_1 /TAXON_ID=186043 /ORGANISM="Entomoneis sp., Strain CCMP2396" /LENGTH=389 /DNA_ID=CAMNT_0043802213 /DNA_START=22 /DNA_END=1191 /DNA_ORIENTATION=-